MWSVYQNGEELFKTKSGKLEKCSNPSGCTRHVHPSPSANKNQAAQVAAEIAAYSKEQDSAVEGLESALSSFEGGKGYNVDEKGFHYTCPNCQTIFDSTKIEYDMDEQVKVHDCDNLTNKEMHQRRKRLMRDMGTIAWLDATNFKSPHEQCLSYQTACRDCAEKHEVQLYEFFTMDEMADIVRPDSVFFRPYKPRTIDLSLPEEAERDIVIRKNVLDVLNDFSESQYWQYLPEKSGMQLELERKGINPSSHYDYENGYCKVCGSKDIDAYCANCWTPSGYLIESND